MKYLFIGLLFSMLWASASVATKFGVQCAPPLVLANLRFFIAGIFLLIFSYSKSDRAKYRFPTIKEFKALSIFGFLNTTLYLGLYVYAMKFTAAGIGSLAVAINPLLIIILSAVWLKRKVLKIEVLSVIIGVLGIGVASYPFLSHNYSSLGGLFLLFLSMLVVSVASVYFATINWNLPGLLINGWQVFIAGIILLPFTVLLSDFSTINFDGKFWFSLLWLSIMVSVLGLICWFYMLAIDPFKASLWLFLCPLFGFLYAWLFMDEPITLFTIIGTVLVIGSLYLGQKDKFSQKT